MTINDIECVDLTTPTGAMRTAVFRPTAPGRYPGLLFYSEIFQVTAPIRRTAALLAGHGFVVAVPEIYHEFEPAGTVLAYDQAGAERGNALKTAKELTSYDDDARAVLAYLQSHPHCTGKLGVMGICLGGHLAFRAAMNPGVQAGVCFYATDIHKRGLGKGMNDNTLDRMKEIHAEMLMIWGRQDPHIPREGRAKVYDAMTDAGVNFTWAEFNGQHAFMRDEGPRYDPELALKCYGLALGLFKRKLGEGELPEQGAGRPGRIPALTGLCQAFERKMDAVTPGRRRRKRSLSGNPPSRKIELSPFHPLSFPFNGSMRLDTVSIIGPGLLGGSVGLAIRQRRLPVKVHAYVRRPESAAECLRLGVADFATPNIREAVEKSDLVILCTPISRMRELALHLRPHLKPGVVVTDVGSVKAVVVQELEPLLREVNAAFIGSHPMAGSEKMGTTGARADLFQNAICLVTPTAQSPSAAVSFVQDFWKSLGALPVRMSPEVHDDLVGRSSHLPHVIAAELANYVLSPAHPKEQAMVCATGFRDTTRIAASSPEMWRDIALANRKNLGRVLGVFIEDLQEFQLALERQDVEAVEEFFTKARQRREQWHAHSASMSPE